jgi:hypothetical protein
MQLYQASFLALVEILVVRSVVCIGFRIFTSSGTYTPTSGLSSLSQNCRVAAAAAAALELVQLLEVYLSVPGGGGGYGKFLITSLARSYAITVGSGGNGGSGKFFKQYDHNRLEWRKYNVRDLLPPLLVVTERLREFQLLQV